jgi:raffinose/stachyose/melibiose transport system substrate-binding protein
MKKKWFCVLSVLLIGATILAGCGGNQSNKSEEATSSPAAPVKVTLKVMGLTPGATDAVKSIVDNYQTQNPNVTIDFQIPPEDPYTLLKTRFAAGDAPDIFYLNAGDFPVWADKLEDLSNEKWMAHVLPAGFPAMTVDGKKLGFPVAVEGHGFLYNKDLFAKAGISNVPTTYSELKQDAEKLKAAGIQPFGEAWKNWGFLMHIFGIPFVYEQDQARFVDQVNKGDKQIKDLANIDSFFKVFDLTVAYGKGKDSIGYDVMDQAKDFAGGKMAMIKQGTWLDGPLSQMNPNLNMGMFAVPLNDNAAQTKLPVASTGYFVANKASQNLIEGKKFLNWLHDNGQKYFVDMMKLNPLFDDQDGSKLGPLIKDMNQYVNNNMVYDNYGIEKWPAGYNTEIAKPLQAYIAGVSDKEQTLKELQSIWTQRIKK